MASIYVDPSASTNGTGSEANPRNLWPTSIGAGDIIYLKRGTHLISATQIGFGAGSNNTLTSYGDVSLPKPKITITATNQGLFSVSNLGVSTFDGIHFDQCLNMGNNGGVIAAQQISGGRASNLNIRNCDFTGVGVNAILLNGVSTATAPETFVCTGCYFEDIGADCVYGGALQYEFSYNVCKKISSRGLFGDGVGFISADPDRVWIHHNYIDHSDVDCKQCIIIDTETPGAGEVIIEDNILIGYGSSLEKPVLHSMVLTQAKAKIRRNIIYTFGLTWGATTASDEFTDNLVIVGNISDTSPSIAITATGPQLRRNTFIGKGLLPINRSIITMGNPSTACLIDSNIFVNFPRAIKSDVSGQNPTCTRNSYWQVIEPRIGFSAAFSEATEITTDPLLTPAYRIKADSPLIAAGTFVEINKDINENTRWNPPTIGAYEYVRPRTMRS